MKKIYLLIVVIIAALWYWFVKKRADKDDETLISENIPSPANAQKKSFDKEGTINSLMSWLNGNRPSEKEKSTFLKALKSMSESEIKDVYNYVFNFINRKIPLTDVVLKTRIMAISNKYGIFD